MDEETKYLKPFDFSVDIDTIEERDRLNGLIDKAFGTGFTMRWGILKGNKVGISGLHGWWDSAIPWGRHFKSIKDFKEHLLMLGYNGQPELVPEPSTNFKEGEWVIGWHESDVKEFVKHPWKIGEIDGEYCRPHGKKGWCTGLEDIRKATNDEIFKHLKKEAEHRGFKEGSRLTIDAETGLSRNFDHTPFMFKDLEYNSEYDWLCDGHGNVVYCKGKWSEPVPNTMVDPPETQNADDPLIVDTGDFDQPSPLVDSSGTTHHFYRTDWDLLQIDPEKFSGQQKPTKDNLVHQTPVGIQKKKQKKRRIKIV